MGALGRGYAVFAGVGSARAGRHGGFADDHWASVFRGDRIDLSAATGTVISDDCFRHCHSRRWLSPVGLSHYSRILARTRCSPVAGVSRGAGLPTAWDIVVDLIQQIAGDETANIDATTAEGWYEARFGRSPTYSDVVERLALTH